MTTTFVYTPYSGVFTPDNKRGIAKNAAATMQQCLSDIRAGRVGRVVIQRAFGMFEKDIGHSWELEDERYAPDVSAKTELKPYYNYQMISDECELNNVTLAFCVGLKVDGVPLDMAIPGHRAALVRKCKWAREWGATELWVDTGGDIANRMINSKNPIGLGALDAAHIAADQGIRLVVEYTKHMESTDYCIPTYERIRRRATDPATVYGTPRKGVPSFVCYGFNPTPGEPKDAPKCEPPEEVQAYADKGHEMVAWNAAAREQAVKQATETEVRG